MPFVVETFGRRKKEAMDWLRATVDAVAERDPQVAAAGHWGNIGLLNAWQTHPSVALQKANATRILQAGRVRGSADLSGDTGWEEDIEDLLRDAAAAAWASFSAWSAPWRNKMMTVIVRSHSWPAGGGRWSRRFWPCSLCRRMLVSPPNVVT